MKKLSIFFLNMIFSFFFLFFSYFNVRADVTILKNDIDIIEKEIVNDNDNNIDNNSDHNYLYKYLNRDDLFDFISNPYLIDIAKPFNKEYFVSYALPYHSTRYKHYTISTPLEKYSVDLNNFSLKDVSFFNSDYDAGVSDWVSSFVISSMLGAATNDLIGLNIFSGTDYYGIAGFQAIVRPFKNLHFAYSYLTDQEYNNSTFKLNYGYKHYRNLIFKTMSTYGDDYKNNTTFGVEWQFYF